MEAKLLGAGQDEGDASVQDLKVALAQHKFALARKGLPEADKAAIVKDVEAAIREHDMTFVYQHFCSHLGWSENADSVATMRAANEAKIKEIDERIAECEKNEGDEEVRDAMLDRADYLCNIGDKENAWKAYDEVIKKSASANLKMTIAFCKVRLELLFGNWTDIKQLLEDARHVCDKGGDWEKKNRLMVYEGLYSLAQRQFQRAAKLFLESVATFTTYELCSYESCIFYAIVASIITLPRPDLKQQVVDASEVLTVIDKLPGPKRMLHALYFCHYTDFFPGFLTVVAALEQDMYLSAHVRFFMREARVVVYRQFLASYKSVTIAAMATAFGVGEAFIDSELSEFIVAGQLTAKIDKVRNVVVTTAALERHAQYQRLIKDGDLLLNRIQKLSKIVDVE